MKNLSFFLVIMCVLTASASVDAQCVTGDTSAPAQIKTLSVKQRDDVSLIVEFISPTDSSSLAEYDLRVRIGSPITALNFATSTRIINLPAPRTQNSSESFVVTGLTPESLYYVAIKTKDSCNNNKWSLVSNVASAYTLVSGKKILKLAWEPSYYPSGAQFSEGNYIVYCGVSSGNYDIAQTVGLNLTATMVVNKTNNYCAAKAVPITGTASGFSNEVISGP